MARVKKAVQIEAPAHSKIGASSMYRWAACPGSVKLCEGVPSAPSSKYAEEGTEAHEHAAARLMTGKWAPEITDEMKEAVSVYVDLIEKEKPSNGAEGTLLIEHGFDLSKVHPGCFGTCDAVIFDSRKSTLRVYDYKHGAGIPVEVERNVQLMYYGLGALLSTSFRANTVELVIVQPRCFHENGPIRRWAFPAIEILDFADDLKEAAVRTEDPKARLIPGEHCRFCAAVGVCPAIEERAKQTAKSEFDVVQIKNTGFYDPKKLAEKLQMFPVIEAWMEGVRAFAYSEAEAGRVPPGFKLVAKRAMRRWRDEKAAAKFFEEEYHPSTARTLFDPPTLKSPAQVEKALHKNQHEKLEPLIIAISSGNVLVPVTDSRPEAKRVTAAEEFQELDVFS